MELAHTPDFIGTGFGRFIVVDGLRRMRKQKLFAYEFRAQCKQRQPSCQRQPELPSGGYRVRSAADHSKTEPLFGQEPISSNSNSSTYGSFEFKAQDDRADFFSTELFEPDAFASTATTAATPSAAPKSESKPEPEPIVAPDFPEPKLIPKARPVNLDEAVPMLLDVEELGADEQSAPAIHVEPQNPCNRPWI